MNDHIIERVEDKYLITEVEQAALLAQITKNLKRDEYFSEEVISVYYDTKDSALAIRSIDRPAFRSKVRIRSYNTPKLDSKIFFEIKSKLKTGKKKIGNKRRLLLPLKDFYRYVKKGEDLVEIVKGLKGSTFRDVQIARELDYLMKFYQLEPKVLIAADRLAYVGKDDASFRLTFDENLRFRETNLRLEKGSKGEKFFPQTDDPKHCVIMEVKTMNAMPPWFVAVLSSEHIYPTRFSKYGKIYQLLTERENNV